MVRAKFSAERNPTGRARWASWSCKRLLFAVAGLVAGAGITGSAHAALPLQLVYRVSHALAGDVGSYTCTVQPLGNGASEVRSREVINAKMFGIPVYHMEAADTERWQGNRLVSFYGVTEKAGTRTEIRGEAQGDRFVITSPQGMIIAAANVHPAQPCASDFLGSTAILRPDTGGVEQVRLSGGAPASVIIAGAPIATRKYLLDGKTRYTVWLDSRNLPVRFAIDDNTGQAIFTLAKCNPCNTPHPRLGMD